MEAAICRTAVLVSGNDHLAAGGAGPGECVQPRTYVDYWARMRGADGARTPSRTSAPDSVVVTYAFFLIFVGEHMPQLLSGLPSAGRARHEARRNTGAGAALLDEHPPTNAKHLLCLSR